MLFILSVKEDAAVYLAGAAIGIPFSFKVRKWIPITLFVISVAVFIFNTKWFIPHNSGAGSYAIAEAASAYGTHLSEIVPNMIKNWDRIVVSIVTGRWLTMAGAFLFLPLLNPFILCSVLPFALVHTLAYSYVMKNIMLYYPAPYIPFLFFGFILFIAKDAVTPRVKWFAVAFMTFHLNFIGGAYLAVKQTDSEFSKLSQLKLKIDASKPMCLQGVLIPHFGYPRDVKLLSPECATQPFYYYLLNSRLDPFPLIPKKFQEAKQLLDNNPEFEREQLGNFTLYRRKQSL